MNTGARMTVLKGDKFACVRIVGRATFKSSIDFKTLIEELSKRGCVYFVLELSECPLMDSTFLGVLAGIGLRMRQPGHPTGSNIELLNPNERVLELLETLGVLHLFRVNHGSSPACFTGIEEREHSPGALSKAELSQVCLEAHQTLMDIHPENVARFKDVAQFLAEDIRNS